MKLLWISVLTVASIALISPTCGQDADATRQQEKRSVKRALVDLYRRVKDHYEKDGKNVNTALSDLYHRVKDHYEQQNGRNIRTALKDLYHRVKDHYEREGGNFNSAVADLYHRVKDHYEHEDHDHDDHDDHDHDHYESGWDRESRISNILMEVAEKTRGLGRTFTDWTKVIYKWIMVEEGIESGPPTSPEYSEGYTEGNTEGNGGYGEYTTEAPQTEGNENEGTTRDPALGPDAYAEQDEQIKTATTALPPKTNEFPGEGEPEVELGPKINEFGSEFSKEEEEGEGEGEGATRSPATTELPPKTNEFPGEGEPEAELGPKINEFGSEFSKEEEEGEGEGEGTTRSPELGPDAFVEQDESKNLKDSDVFDEWMEWNGSEWVQKK